MNIELARTSKFDIKKILIGVIFLVSLLVMLTPSVYAKTPGEGAIGGGGISPTDEVELCEYKWSINSNYPNKGIEGEDYVVSNRGIRYAAVKFARANFLS